MTDLEVLNLNGTGITDVGLSKIAQFRKLRLLDLRGTYVTSDALRQLDGLLGLQFSAGPFAAADKNS
jgi:hypothetical protein